jgi:hypothetical protein
MFSADVAIMAFYVSVGINTLFFKVYQRMNIQHRGLPFSSTTPNTARAGTRTKRLQALSSPPKPKPVLKLTDISGNNGVSIKKSHFTGTQKRPQQFLERQTSMALPDKDWLNRHEHTTRMQKMARSANGITEQEKQLAHALRKQGYQVVSQYLMPDEDNGKRLVWAYDLAVIPPKATPKSGNFEPNWNTMFLVEVDGSGHKNNAFVRKQGKRKAFIASYILKMPLVRVLNKDVDKPGIIKQLVQTANQFYKQIPSST